MSVCVCEFVCEVIGQKKHGKKSRQRMKHRNPSTRKQELDPVHCACMCVCVYSVCVYVCVYVCVLVIVRRPGLHERNKSGRGGKRKAKERKVGRSRCGAPPTRLGRGARSRSRLHPHV